ncbi:hypothetical protein SSYRP_v1c03250 [Spiroplasma syrphidicola EA-1]|uniref:Transmembrane protein n=1 Tax=Spiroplasma syrphidicola EA-1 TaxID=1276229 RepID=R4UDC8_9MOLU|nr:hypothetical protein [Spiroplasma syrphidicola]AGM25919.1 hypothetical protein SSYRP_v1c03250 [Spiroplasma syrphidicola EA-1]
MQQNWDNFLFNPLLLLLLFLFYGLFIFKSGNIKALSQKIFLIEIFCFWFALFLIIGNSVDLSSLLNNFGYTGLDSLLLLFAISIGFYAFIFMIPFLFWQKRLSKFSWRIFHYVIYSLVAGGILVFTAYPNIVTTIILSVILGAGATIKGLNYLSYNEIYGKKFFPFKTVSLIAPLITLALLAGNDLNLLIISSTANVLNSRAQFSIIGSLAFLAILSALVLYWFFARKNFTATSFTVEQQKALEPFRWYKVLIIFVMLFFIIVLKEVSQSNIYLWLLGQRTWEKYHNIDIVNQFIRLNQQFFFIPQFFGAYLACHVLYNKLGIKYSFALGMFFWFIFFAVSAFNHSPEAFLVLQLINGLAYAMCFNILFAMVCEWKYRAPNNLPIVGQFQLLFFGSEFLVQFTDNIFKYKKVGIFADYVLGQNFIETPNFAVNIDNITTIIFTVAAMIILGILVGFYFTSDLILAEYRNHLVLLVPKINILLRESLVDKVQSQVSNITSSPEQR